MIQSSNEKKTKFSIIKYFTPLVLLTLFSYKSTKAVALAININSPAEIEIIKHGSRKKNKISLTFDACPLKGKKQFDEEIAKVLIENNIPATLFISGRWAEHNKKTLKKLAANSLFEIGNHSHTHPHLPKLTDEEILKEISLTQDTIEKITQLRPKLFRAPFGEYDQRVLLEAKNKGLQTIEYDLASGDPDPQISKEKLIEYVVSMTRKGSIIVMHINGRGWHTAEALPEILKGLKTKNFDFVKVSDLLN